jgi:hypothetical protein
MSGVSSYDAVKPSALQNSQKSDEPTRQFRKQSTLGAPYPPTTPDMGDVNAYLAALPWGNP